MRVKQVSPEAMALLKSYDWPGNVRELENTMHRAVLLAQGDTIAAAAVLLPDASGNLNITGTGASQAPSTPKQPTAAHDSAPSVAGGAAPAHEGDDANTATLVGKTVAEVERELIIDTLQHCLGNRTHAANILGISIRTLRNKLNQYQTEGVSVPPPGDGGHRATL